MASTVATKKTLLLDFDGVVLRRCAAHTVVSTRARAYTRKHLSQRHSRGPSVGDQFCDALYTTYGHTVLGLRALGCDAATKAEFDNYVYRYVDGTYFTDVRQEQHHRRHATTLLRLVDTCTKSSIGVHLFSNAPDGWCATALNAMDPRGDLASALMSPSMAAVTGHLLKPEPAAYTLVEEFLRGDQQQHKDQSHDTHCVHVKHDIWFVDDNLCNMHPILHKPNWHKVVVHQHDAEISTHGGKEQYLGGQVHAGLYVIPSLNSLVHL